MPEKPFTDETRERLVQLFTEYRSGRVNLAEAQKIMVREGGFLPQVARLLLAQMKRENVASIRGHAHKKKE